MVYMICAFAMKQNEKLRVSLWKEEDESYIVFDDEEEWIFSESVDDERAKLAYLQIVSEMIDGMRVDLDQFGIF